MRTLRIFFLVAFSVLLVGPLSRADEFAARPASSNYTYAVDAGTWDGNALTERRVIVGDNNAFLPRSTSQQAYLADAKSALSSLLGNFVDCSNVNHSTWDFTPQFSTGEGIKMWNQANLIAHVGAPANFFSFTPWRGSAGSTSQWDLVTNLFAHLRATYGQPGLLDIDSETFYIAPGDPSSYRQTCYTYDDYPSYNWCNPSNPPPSPVAPVITSTSVEHELQYSIQFTRGMSHTSTRDYLNIVQGSTAIILEDKQWYASGYFDEYGDYQGPADHADKTFRARSNYSTNPIAATVGLYVDFTGTDDLTAHTHTNVIYQPAWHAYCSLWWEATQTYSWAAASYTLVSNRPTRLAYETKGASVTTILFTVDCDSTFGFSDPTLGAMVEEVNFVKNESCGSAPNTSEIDFSCAVKKERDFSLIGQIRFITAWDFIYQ